jgi:hypothetical protein
VQTPVVSRARALRAQTLVANRAVALQAPLVVQQQVVQPLARALQAHRAPVRLQQ